MTARSRILLWLTALVGLTRLLAIAASLWDWDEAQFALALSEYDVLRHHPHPPGYPLFVAAANVVKLLLPLDNFRALQLVSVIASVGVFPSCYWFARRAGFEFATAVHGALLTAFLPNVWVYGGTAHSDVPAAVIGMMACALLFASARTSATTSYVLGASVLAFGGAVRPTTILLGLVPWCMLTLRRGRARWRSFVAAVTVFLLVLTVHYGAAAAASGGIGRFAQALVRQTAWVIDVDSSANAGRPSLAEAAWMFFVVPVANPVLFVPLGTLAIAAVVVGIARRESPVVNIIATLVPVALFSWLTLDISCVGRYAIQYAPMIAILAAHGAAIASRVLPPRLRGAHAIVVALIAYAVVWTAPGLVEVVTTDSPPTRALAWTMRSAPRDAAIYVHAGLRPHAEYYVPPERLRLYTDVREIAEHNAFLVSPIEPIHGARVFARRRDPLWSIVRQRNFETFAARLSSATVEFRRGWHDPEADGVRTWRWMGAEAVAELPPLAGTGQLTLDLYVPLDALRERPTIRIYVNDALLYELVATSPDIARSWILASRADRNTLRITTSATVNPAAELGMEDARPLGVRLDTLRWTGHPQ